MPDREPAGSRRRLFRSFGDALRGVWNCVESERNMRIHLTACCYVVFFGCQLPLTRGEWAALVLAMALVTGAEAMNTAVEKLCDFAQKRHSLMIRVVKDAAAGAVLLCAVGAAAAGLTIFLRRELWQAVWGILTSPLALLGFVLSLGAALAFILLGPRGLRDRLERLWKK